MGTLQFFASLLIFSLFCYTYACGYYYEEVTLKSLLPSSDCPRSPTRRGSMKVVSMHGPCFGNDAPTPFEILYKDQARVASIHSRIRLPRCLRTHVFGSFNVMSGLYLGSTSFVVTVKLGSKEEEITLIIDTGSDLTWTQCWPCQESCYNQEGPIFNPTKSKSYSNILRKTKDCAELLYSTTTGDSPQYILSTSTPNCVYSVTYADGSYSGGYFAEEKISLVSDQKVIIGCGQNNKGSYGRTAGVLGLGPGPISIVTKSAQGFSYCLPSESSASGYLSFGNSGVPSTVKFTRLVESSEGPSGYFITLRGIRVGRRMLPIPKTVFSRTGTIIDSGTVITRLPKQAYAELRDAFRSILKDYPLADPFDKFLDTCYEFHDRSGVPVPPIEFIFDGDVVMEVEKRRVYYPVSRTKLCLAFAESEDANTPGILGSYQQVTQHIVYDVAGGRLGIGKGGCQ